MKGYLLLQRPDSATGLAKLAGIDGMPDVVTDWSDRLIKVNGEPVDPETATWGPVLVPAEQVRRPDEYIVRSPDGSMYERRATAAPFFTPEQLGIAVTEVDPVAIYNYEQNRKIAATILSLIKQTE